MFKIDNSHIKKTFKYYILFIVTGLILIGIGIFLMTAGNKKQKEFDSTTTAILIDKNCDNKTEVNISDEGTSVDSSNLCYPVYFFNVASKKYSCNTKSGLSPSLVDEKKNKVYYDSKNPKNCKTELDSSSESIAYLIVLGLGSLVLLSGLISLINGTIRLKNNDKLKQNGTLFKNLPYELQSGNLQAGNKKTMCPVVNLPLPNNTIVKLKGFPRFDYDLNNKYIDVLVDLNNPKKNYYIDYNIEYTGTDPNRVFDLKSAERLAPVENTPKLTMPVDPILEEKTVAIPTIAAGAVPIPLKTEPEHSESAIPNVVKEFSIRKDEPIAVPTSPEASEPAVLIPGVNSPAEAEAAPAAPVGNSIGDEPAVIIPGVNDGTTPVPSAPVEPTISVPPTAPVAIKPAPAPIEETPAAEPAPAVVAPVETPVLGPVSPTPKPKEEVIPVIPVLGPDEPTTKDDLPSWAEKGN